MFDSIRYGTRREKFGTTPREVSDLVDSWRGKPLDPAYLRTIPDAHLAYCVANGGRLDVITPYTSALISMEQKRREAWDAPAAMSALVAICALLVAAMSLAGSRSRAPAGPVMEPHAAGICRAIERDMLSARPRRADDPQIFAALHCRLSSEARVVYAPATPRERAAGVPLEDGGYTPPASGTRR